MNREILAGHVNEITNNLVHCTVMYVVETGVHPTREILPLNFFGWMPQSGDSFDMIIELDENGTRTLSRIICTNLTVEEVKERNLKLTKLHEIGREWTIAEIDTYIDQVMHEISEEIRKKQS